MVHPGLALFSNLDSSGLFYKIYSMSIASILLPCDIVKSKICIRYYLVFSTIIGKISILREKEVEHI